MYRVVKAFRDKQQALRLFNIDDVYNHEDSTPERIQELVDKGHLKKVKTDVPAPVTENKQTKASPKKSTPKK